MEIEVEIDGVRTRITDVSPYREVCTQIEAELQRIYADFDPMRPDRLLAVEPQLVTHHNTYRQAKEIIARWEDEERGCANILEVWELYREIEDGRLGS